MLSSLCNTFSPCQKLTSLTQKTQLYRTKLQDPQNYEPPKPTQTDPKIQPRNLSVAQILLGRSHTSVCGPPGIKRINNKQNPLPSERNALDVVVTRAGPVSHNYHPPGPARTNCHGMAWHARYQIPATRAALNPIQTIIGPLYELNPRVEQECGSQTPPVELLITLPRPDAFPIQKLLALGLIIRVGRLFSLLLFKRGALLLVERKGLLQPAECAALLLDRLAAARLVGHGRLPAHDAHPHRRRRISRGRRKVVRADGPGGVRSLLQRRVGAGLDGAEELPLGVRGGDHARVDEGW